MTTQKTKTKITKVVSGDWGERDEFQEWNKKREKQVKDIG